MNIIKLNAIDSTNSYLINLGKKEVLEDSTIVVTINQKKGRGQLASSWQSTTHKSLTFSVFKRFEDLPVQRMSVINFAVSIAIYKVLKKISLPNTTIKWPNDIMSHSKKVAGILIENQIKKGKIISSVIGVGLNVNEEKFNNLSQATSILLATGIKHNLDELLLTISKAILEELEKAEKGEFQPLKAAYENSLFRKNKITVFENSLGDRFNGIIKGVTDLGEIVIENEEEILNNYYSKELKYLF